MSATQAGSTSDGNVAHFSPRRARSPSIEIWSNFTAARV
jgi:hypothetical protein